MPGAQATLAAPPPRIRPRPKACPLDAVALSRRGNVATQQAARLRHHAVNVAACRANPAINPGLTPRARPCAMLIDLPGRLRPGLLSWKKFSEKNVLLAEKYRDHRPTLTTASHAGRPVVPPIRHLPRKPADRGTGDGFGRSGKGARDHHPCQVHQRRMGTRRRGPPASTSSTPPATPISGASGTYSHVGVLSMVDGGDPSVGR